MKTFIEVSFPGKEVSVESAREKNISTGISLLCIHGGLADLWHLQELLPMRL